MKKRRKRKNIINVPVASMGDIAFLLIIFFMVASHLAHERHQINPPRSLDALKIKESQISVAIDMEGKIYLQGRLVDSADDIETGVKAMLANKTTEEQRTVIFRCDKDINRDQYMPVIEAIVNAGGLIGAVGDEGKPVGPENLKE